MVQASLMPSQTRSKWNPKPSFSIAVIGTHLDHESVKKDQQNKQEREEQVKKLAKESGVFLFVLNTKK